MAARNENHKSAAYHSLVDGLHVCNKQHMCCCTAATVLQLQQVLSQDS